MATYVVNHILLLCAIHMGFFIYETDKSHVRITYATCCSYNTYSATIL